MDVDLRPQRRAGTIAQAWRETLRARGSDRVYLGLTAAAFVLGVIDSVTSATLETVVQMAMLHAAGTATGIAGRGARLRAEASDRAWQPQLIVGHLLGALTLSSAFCATLLVTAAFIGHSPESVVREGITALSGVWWIAGLVFLLSAFLPRRLDSVVALIVAFAGPPLYHARTQFSNAMAARAIEAIWPNIGVLVVFSDASPGTTAWADTARWASNVAIALVTGLVISSLRSGTRIEGRQWRWVLAIAGGVALGARLLVPGVEDRVEWIEFASSNARIDSAGRPVLYNFTAEWCPFCDRLEHDLFAERRDAKWINEHFVPVRVLDRKREDGRNSEAVEQLRERFQIDGFPSLIVLAPDGTVLARHQGYSGNLTEVRQVLSRSLMSR